MVDLLLTNAVIATRPGSALFSGALAIESGNVAAIVPAGNPLPAAEEVWDVEGRLVTAGLIDPHTHLVFGGDRVDDFRRRLAGEDYQSIAAAGGGIRATVERTRAATEDQLLTAATERLLWLADSGCTTVEIKSGYGLDTSHEQRMLQVAGAAGAAAGVRVEPCLLAAHVVPEDMSKPEYLELVCNEMVPDTAAKGLAQTVDVFIESIAFDAHDARLVFEAAARHGMGIKAHVGQFSSMGGPELASEFKALSIDHCEHLDLPSLEPLASSGTTVVLVPGASFFLGDTTIPPIEALRSRGIPMAVSTDLNPGSSPMASPLLAAALAVHRFGLTPDEAFAGVTTNAARALGLRDRRGTLEPGMDGDIAIWNAGSPTELVYWLGAPLCHGTIVKGHIRGRAAR